MSYGLRDAQDRVVKTKKPPTLYQKIPRSGAKCAQNNSFLGGQGWKFGKRKGVDVWTKRLQPYTFVLIQGVEFRLSNGWAKGLGPLKPPHPTRPNEFTPSPFVRTLILLKRGERYLWQNHGHFRSILV